MVAGRPLLPSGWLQKGVAEKGFVIQAQRELEEIVKIVMSSAVHSEDGGGAKGQAHGKERHLLSSDLICPK